jgi:hypothetical protein
MTLEDKLRAAKTDGEFCDILNKANGVKTAHYKLKFSPREQPKAYKKYWLFNGTQDVGWVLFLDGHIPHVLICAKSHKIDKYALAVVVREIDPESWGEYFLVTELVTFEDLKDKEFLANYEKELEKNTEKEVKKLE